jgi:hypothetical protein
MDFSCIICMFIFVTGYIILCREICIYINDIRVGNFVGNFLAWGWEWYYVVLDKKKKNCFLVMGMS